MVFPSAPGNGAGMPHSLSLVTDLGLRPSLIMARDMFLAFSGKFLFRSMYSLSSSENFGRSKNQCLVFLTTGVDPQNAHLGPMRSSGVSSLPQTSH